MSGPVRTTVVGGTPEARVALHAALGRLPAVVQSFVAAEVEVLIVDAGHALPLPRDVEWLVVLADDGLRSSWGDYYTAHEVAHCWLGHHRTTGPAEEAAAAALAHIWLSAAGLANEYTVVETNTAA